MKLGSKLQKIAEIWTWLQRLLLLLIFSFKFWVLVFFECLEDEFWTSLNSQRGLKPNLPGFPFSAKLKKETYFRFPKASAAAPEASTATLSFIDFYQFCPFLTYSSSFLPYSSKLDLKHQNKHKTIKINRKYKKSIEKLTPNYRLFCPYQKSTFNSVFTLGGEAIVWRNVKQICTTDSTMELKYVAVCEAAKEAVWLFNFLMDLQVVPKVQEPMTLYCHNSGALQILRNIEATREENTLSKDITC